jgi:hypothetical protein
MKQNTLFVFFLLLVTFFLTTTESKKRHSVVNNSPPWLNQGTKQKKHPKQMAKEAPVEESENNDGKNDNTEDTGVLVERPNADKKNTGMQFGQGKDSSTGAMAAYAAYTA